MTAPTLTGSLTAVFLLVGASCRPPPVESARLDQRFGAPAPDASVLVTRAKVWTETAPGRWKRRPPPRFHGRVRVEHDGPERGPGRVPYRVVIEAPSDGKWKVVARCDPELFEGAARCRVEFKHPRNGTFPVDLSFFGDGRVEGSAEGMDVRVDTADP